MRRWVVIVQTSIFSIGVFMLLFLLSVAVHFPMGRVTFAVLISGICLVAELFALFKLMQLIWRISERLARLILRSAPSHHPSPIPFDRDEELKHI